MFDVEVQSSFMQKKQSNLAQLFIDEYARFIARKHELEAQVNICIAGVRKAIEVLQLLAVERDPSIDKITDQQGILDERLELLNDAYRARKEGI